MNPRVVCFGAGYRMSAHKSVPLAVDFLGFENQEKERFEPGDVAPDPRRRVTKSIPLSGSRADHPEFSRDLGKNV